MRSIKFFFGLEQFVKKLHENLTLLYTFQCKLQLHVSLFGPHKLTNVPHL